MLYRVVLSHNQTESIHRFPSGCSTMFVFDAPTEGDVAECCRHGCAYTSVPTAGNRGANRNAGLQKVVEAFRPGPGDYVEFFDGDRYPIKYSPNRVVDLMERHDIQCTLYTCEDDSRFEKIHVPESGATVVDTGTLCNPFYSCGFIMQMAAIQEIMAFNGGYLFEPRFTRWGSEDQYLGLVCDCLKHKVAITREVVLNGSVGGDCGSHQEYRETVQLYVDLIRERNLPLRCWSRASQEIV